MQCKHTPKLWLKAIKAKAMHKYSRRTKDRKTKKRKQQQIQEEKKGKKIIHKKRVLTQQSQGPEEKLAHRHAGAN